MAAFHDFDRGRIRHVLAGAAVTCALVLAPPSVKAQQPIPPPWQAEFEKRLQIDPGSVERGERGQTGAGESSATPHAAPVRPAEAAPGRLTLTASLAQDGEAIDQGLVWRVYAETPGVDPPQIRLVATSNEAVPALTLPPGNYAINAAFGRAHLTRRIVVADGQVGEERFVLNAGGLRVTALLGPTEKVPDLTVSYDVYQGDADQLGGRTKIAGGLRPGIIVRLNSGLYHLVSTMGDANALVSADVTVEAGKLTDAVISHHAARVTLKLVTRAGGEAQADTLWALHTAQGDLVRETQGALPTHILAAGDYVASARHGGRLYQRQFTVTSGVPAHVEVVMQ